MICGISYKGSLVVMAIEINDVKDIKDLILKEMDSKLKAKLDSINTQVIMETAEITINLNMGFNALSTAIGLVTDVCIKGARSSVKKWRDANTSLSHFPVKIFCICNRVQCSTVL